MSAGVFAAPEGLNRAAGAEAAARPLRVALAEDGADVREQLRLLLAAMGHEAVAVATGRQLAELCRASPPELAIADVRAPGLTSPEAAVALGAAGARSSSSPRTARRGRRRPTTSWPSRASR
jgi:CheY-like chemotaxis protein